jgi:hypothetical protein
VYPVPDPLLLRTSGSAGNRTGNLWVSSQELWPLDNRGRPVLQETFRKPSPSYNNSGCCKVAVLQDLSLVSTRDGHRDNSSIRTYVGFQSVTFRDAPYLHSRVTIPLDYLAMIIPGNL